MKIAAAEAQWSTCQPCSFSAFQIGGGNNDETPTKIIAIPHLLSLLATNHWNGQVVGLNELQTQYEQQYGSGYYIPNVFIQYWSMRVMAYAAVLVLLVALWGLWLMWRKRLERSTWFLRAAVGAVVLPFVMNTAGWLLTESGRQPWIVQGIQLTKDGVSPSVSTTEVVISIIVFFILYTVLTGIWAVLMVRFGKREVAPERPPGEEDQPVPAMTY
jgi:cytochrome d ubiquinol oxidase subunit I